MMESYLLETVLNAENELLKVKTKFNLLSFSRFAYERISFKDH